MIGIAKMVWSSIWKFQGIEEGGTARMEQLDYYLLLNYCLIRLLKYWLIRLLINWITRLRFWGSFVWYYERPMLNVLGNYFFVFFIKELEVFILSRFQNVSDVYFEAKNYTYIYNTTKPFDGIFLFDKKKPRHCSCTMSGETLAVWPQPVDAALWQLSY